MNTNLSQYVDTEHQNFIAFREKMLEVELELMRLSQYGVSSSDLEDLAAGIQLALKESFRGLVG